MMRVKMNTKKKIDRRKTMKSSYIMFEEILNEYKKVRENLPKRDMSWLEKLMNAILIFCAIAVCVGTIYFTYIKNLEAEQFLITIIVIVIIVTIIINEVQYRMQWEKRLERHRERLKKLKKLLEKRGWDSEKKIELLIEWCDSYSRMDSPWIKELEPFGKIFTVCIIRNR